MFQEKEQIRTIRFRLPWLLRFPPEELIRLNRLRLRWSARTWIVRLLPGKQPEEKNNLNLNKI